MKYKIKDGSLMAGNFRARCVNQNNSCVDICTGFEFIPEFKHLGGKNPDGHVIQPHTTPASVILHCCKRTIILTEGE